MACYLCSHRDSVLYVSDHRGWADKIFRRFTSCRTDYNKIANRGKLGKSGQGQYKNLTALQRWKYERYSFLAPFYKQGQKTLQHNKSGAVLGGIQATSDGSSDEGPEDDNESTQSDVTRKEPRQLFQSSLTSPPGMRKTMKRTREKDQKVSPDEKSAHYGELVTVMKQSASHLTRTSAADTRDPERDSFFAWLTDFTLRMPRNNWRQFQMRTVSLAMEFTPAESPQPNTARSRLEPEQQQQHSLHPPPRPIGPAGTTFIDLSQAQPSQQYQGAPQIPNQMVSALLSYCCRTQIRTFVVGSLARTFCMLFSIDCT